MTSRHGIERVVAHFRRRKSVHVAWLSLLATAWHPVHAAVPACMGRQIPRHFEAPRLPKRLHNTFAGSVLVRVVIDPSGAVSDASIQRMALHPTGSASGAPEGYAHAVLQAARSWTYVPRARACHYDQVVVIRFRDQ